MPMITMIGERSNPIEPTRNIGSARRNGPSTGSVIAKITSATVDTKPRRERSNGIHDMMMRTKRHSSQILMSAQTIDIQKVNERD